MHRQVAHNRLHAGFRQFTAEIFRFFYETHPRERDRMAESVIDSFRTVTHDGYRMVG